MAPSYKLHQEQVVKNAKTLSETLLREGLRLVSGGTDTHLMIIDCTTLGITGKEGARLLEECGIYTNFNMIPFDTRKPNNPSGIRLGTPALTSRGMTEHAMQSLGTAITRPLKDRDAKIKTSALTLIKELTAAYPLP